MTIDKKISVLLADDSSVIRGALTKILISDPSIDVVSSVANGEIAITMARVKKPDIIILDVEMPVMDGLTALPKILEVSPDTKIVMCSSLTAKGAETTMKAMALGAVECIVKPTTSQGARDENSPFKKALLNLVLTLGKTSRPAPLSKAATATPSVSRTVTPLPKKEKAITLRNDASAYRGEPSIIAIGSSTGGPQALFKTLKNIGKLKVPIVITQHMPATFTKILANHIQQQTGIPAFECEEGMSIEAGCVYVAPGGKHLLFEKDTSGLKAVLNDGPMENYCKPAVDPMMRSLVDIYGASILCVILTGMGHDGLEGVRALIKKGGRVIAQDEETSVVWGMPGAVANDGLCSAVLPLDDIGLWVRKACFLA